MHCARAQCLNLESAVNPGATMNTDWKQRIIVEPDILAGKPVIKGTRISVELILERTADGWSLEDILSSYPSLSREDALAAQTTNSLQEV
jgi:uncharacterized protein (DUF433 family)